MAKKEKIPPATRDLFDQSCSDLSVWLRFLGKFKCGKREKNPRPLLRKREKPSDSWARLGFPKEPKRREKKEFPSERDLFGRHRTNLWVRVGLLTKAPTASFSNKDSGKKREKVPLPLRICLADFAPFYQCAEDSLKVHIWQIDGGIPQPLGFVWRKLLQLISAVRIS